MATTGTEAPVTPLRERKKRSTRDALRRSAVTLVAEHGLNAVTVEDITAAVDISARTFFNYFPCKEDAVVGWDPLELAELREHLVARPLDESPPEALRRVLVELFGRYDADHRELLQRTQVIRTDPRLVAHYVARWGDLERELVAALAQRRGTDPDNDHYAGLVVATTLAAGRVAVMSWCDNEGRVALSESVPRYLDILGAGLAEPAQEDAI
jgi:AcrR family transcriptional regulator